MVLILRIARSLLRLRYIVVGSAVGGGIHASKKIDEWKEKMPDFRWLSEVLPDSEKVDKFRDALEEMVRKFAAEDGVFTKASATASDKFDLLKQWIEEAKMNRKKEMAEKNSLLPSDDIDFRNDMPTNDNQPNSHTNSKSSQQYSSSSTSVSLQQEKFAKLQNELNTLQMKYRREIERLENENKELRKRVLINSKESKVPMKIRKSLIDMYSDVLDELNDYDTSYNTQDHLPRVVVIGDQSAGKTSVLEMIAGARIFPRGGGEMMTRSPVKVTLSEGPYHIAKFKDSSREYDVTDESELNDLRKEIESRMRNSVRGGKTVSHEVISLSVQGPGIPRMVLVDLPGIISTVTTEMADNTREAIKDISMSYMRNPNAIILCIQDGSIDAERSIVTELVSQMDPIGKRTIFVLTKVDLAEQNMTNPSRIRKILDGKLFPMKALGYFAVVTGKGDRDERIEAIRRYEEDFFSSSTLCRDGILNPSQCSTQNLSLAVSDCFWKMVKASVEQQADAFKASRFNLETEWHNSFSNWREMDRDELFEKLRNHLFEEIVHLSQLAPSYWEETLSTIMVNKIRLHIIDNIFIPGSDIDNKGLSRTHTEIKLKQWVESQLPQLSVMVGLEALMSELQKIVETNKSSPNHDPILDELEKAVIEESIKRHHWEPKAAEVLKVIQLNALEDPLIPDKQCWENTIDFMEKCLKTYLKDCEDNLNKLKGPNWIERWTKWKSKNDENHLNCAVESELRKIVKIPTIKLSSEEIHQDLITTIRQNLQSQQIEVSPERIQSIWFYVFRSHFFNQALLYCEDCRKCFYLYKQGIDSDVKFDDIVLFWRVYKTLNASTNALRQQIMNRERRRLEKEVKEVIDEFSQDEEKKHTLLAGRRVELAEELKRVRVIQEKLEEFILALEKEN